MTTKPAGSGSAARPEGPADAAVVAARMGEEYPDARTELDHRDAFELLVATVLSAQTTDQRVNSLTPRLFAAWPDARSLAGAAEEDVTALLHPLGMGATRARRIVGLAQGLLADHGGEVPDDQAALEALPGVGRKTAHVVRGTWFGHQLLAVDTHVGRLSRRLGWTDSTEPRRIEQDVLDRLRADGAPAEATVLGLRLILHGRRICLARTPRCGQCVLADVCPSADVSPSPEVVR